MTSAVSAASALTLPTSLAINLKTNKKASLIVTVLNESYFLVLDGRTAAVGAEDMARD